MGSNLLMAQAKYGLEYYGELQSDFSGDVNFPNLLRLNFDMPAGRYVTIEASSISIAKTSKERLVNEDYFISPVTSLFTNSSCGIFPTISCNYPIANYPLASVSMHYAFESDHWHALASLYNGNGYNSLLCT